MLPGVARAGDDVPGPVHAGNTFGWYRSGVTRYEFHGTMSSYWDVTGDGVVQDQHGMLTLNTTDTGSESATLAQRGHRQGRWEVRLRSRRFETGHANYRVLTELVPAGAQDQHCGGLNVALERYRIGGDRARFSIRTLPDNSFNARLPMELHNDQWHTYAVEVGPDHISWFVDAAVVRTERRPAALSGVPLTVRFTMEAVPGAQMNRSRMQLDWLRHWTYRYPSTKPITAPQTHQAVFASAC